MIFSMCETIYKRILNNLQGSIVLNFFPQLIFFFNFGNNKIENKIVYFDLNKENFS